MDPFNSARRELLRFGGMGLAAAAATTVPAAYAATKSKASTATSPFFDIRTYGAVGDGKAVDSPAINKAIEAAAAAGGGTVLFPAGTWLSFSIRLKSHVALHLSQGATILAADSPLPGATTGYKGGTYDAAEPNTAWDAYQDYGHNHWHNSLIWGEGINDVSITGPGLIFGKGLSYGAGPGRVGPPRAGFGPDRPAPVAGTPTPPIVRPPRGNYTMFQAEQPGVGNKAIALKNCRNVIFRDFSILKGGHFGLLLTGVDNMTIDNLTIDTDRDGIDIDCCHNVRVSNCFVNSPWDDAICPKSSYALGYNRATENLTITNCYVAGSYELGTMLDGTYKKFAPDVPRLARNGRIKCGTESNGGFKNITISNCVFDGCMGLRSRKRRRSTLRRHRHLQHHHARRRQRPALLASGIAPARTQGEHEGRHSPAHRRQQSRQLQHRLTHLLHPQRHPRTFPSATSRSQTSTSSTRAAAPLKTPKSSCPKMPTGIPTPACSAPRRPRRASFCATSTTSR